MRDSKSLKENVVGLKMTNQWTPKFFTMLKNQELGNPGILRLKCQVIMGL